MEEYRGYIIADSRGHGKAVKGAKKVTTIQVREPLKEGYLLKAQIRYKVGDIVGRVKAVEYAKAFVDRLLNREEP